MIFILLNRSKEQLSEDAVCQDPLEEAKVEAVPGHGEGFSTGLGAVRGALDREGGRD